MSFESQVSEIEFETDGASTVFGLANENGALYFMSGADIRAAFLASDGSEMDLANGVDFSVSGDGRIGAGSLTTNAPLAASGRIRAWCDTPIVQPEHYQENDGFPAATHERAQDRGCMIDRDIARKLSLTVRAPDFDDVPGPMPAKTGRRSRLPIWDANADFAAMAPLAAETGVLIVAPGTGVPALTTISAITGRASGSFDGGYWGLADGDNFDGGVYG